MLAIGLVIVFLLLSCAVGVLTSGAGDCMLSLVFFRAVPGVFPSGYTVLLFVLLSFALPSLFRSGRVVAVLFLAQVSLGLPA